MEPPCIFGGESTPTSIVDILGRVLKRQPKKPSTQDSWLAEIILNCSVNCHESTKNSDIVAIKSYQSLFASLRDYSLPEALKKIKGIGIEKETALELLRRYLPRQKLGIGDDRDMWDRFWIVCPICDSQWGFLRNETELVCKDCLTVLAVKGGEANG